MQMQLPVTNTTHFDILLACLSSLCLSLLHCILQAHFPPDLQHHLAVALLYRHFASYEVDLSGPSGKSI